MSEVIWLINSKKMDKILIKIEYSSFTQIIWQPKPKELANHKKLATLYSKIHDLILSKAAFENEDTKLKIPCFLSLN
jgi:hypothetical protein